MGGGISLPGVLGIGEEAWVGMDCVVALVSEQLADGVNVPRMVDCIQGVVQGWRTRGREGVVAASREGRVGSEGGASQRWFPGGGDPGQDSEGGCGCPTFKSVDQSKFGDGQVAKGAGGGAKR